MGTRVKSKYVTERADQRPRPLDETDRPLHSEPLSERSSSLSRTSVLVETVLAHPRLLILQKHPHVGVNFTRSIFSRKERHQSKQMYPETFFDKQQCEKSPLLSSCHRCPSSKFVVGLTPVSVYNARLHSNHFRFPTTSLEDHICIPSVAEPELQVERGESIATEQVY